MIYANITIEINGVEIDTTVEYEFTPEVPAKLTGHPDNWQEAELEEWEITKLTATDDEYDFSELLQVDDITETIIESIRESWDD